jgi:hypothetical protein
LRLSAIKKLLEGLSLSVVGRGPGMAPSKEHLMVYSSNQVDGATEKDLRSVRVMNDRVLWFGVGGRYFFVSSHQSPRPHISVFRLWGVSLNESRDKLLDRINRLNRETTVQKVTVGDTVTKYPGIKDKTVHGTISVDILIPKNGLAREDLESAIKSLLVVPVEDKLEAKSRTSTKKRDSSEYSDVTFDAEGNFASSRKPASKAKAKNNSPKAKSLPKKRSSKTISPRVVKG